MLGGAGNTECDGKECDRYAEMVPIPHLICPVWVLLPPSQSFQNPSKEPGSLDFLPRWRGCCHFCQSHTQMLRTSQKSFLTEGQPQAPSFADCSVLK